MCFIVSNKYPVELIASRNIPCYKVVNNDYSSLFHCGSLYYDKYKKYYAKKEDTDDKLEVLNVEPAVVGNLECDIINEGIHSYSPFRYKNALCDTKVIYCIIPKGERYYYNSTDNEYVSLSIRRIPYIYYKILNYIRNN